MQTKTTAAPILSGGFRHMLAMGNPHMGWQRPGPVFEVDDGTGNAGADEAAAAAAEAARLAAEAKKLESKPSDDAAKLLKEVMKLKNTLKEKDESLKRFEGIDPEAVKTMLAEREEDARKAAEAEEDRLKRAGEFDTLQKATREAHAKELKAAQDKIDAERKSAETLQRTIRELTVGTAFANSQFLRDETVLTPAKARRVYEAHFDVVEGVITPFNKERGETGREPIVDGSGSPLGFDAAMKAIIEADDERDHLLKAKTKQGSGAAPAAGGKATSEPSGGKLDPLKIIAMNLGKLPKDGAK